MSKNEMGSFCVQSWSFRCIIIFNTNENHNKSNHRYIYLESASHLEKPMKVTGWLNLTQKRQTIVI